MQQNHVEHFIVKVKKNVIVLYTPDQNVDLLVDTLSLLAGSQGTRVKAVLEKALTSSPMFQLVMTDKASRLFKTQRFCFLSSIDYWLTISNEDELPRLVKTFVKHLGKESFYDLH